MQRDGARYRKRDSPLRTLWTKQTRRQQSARPARISSGGPLVALPQGRGFSLIETAIVLGIVALVLGGIWAAYATIQEKQRRNIAYNALVQTMAWINNNYQNISANIPNGTADTELTSALYETKTVTGLYPIEPDFTEVLVGPWENTQFYVYRWNPSGTTFIYIWMLPIAPTACEEIVRRLSTFKLNRYRVSTINNVTAANVMDGLTSAEVATMCDGATTDAINISMQ